MSDVDERQVSRLVFQVWRSSPAPLHPALAAVLLGHRLQALGGQHLLSRILAVSVCVEPVPPLVPRSYSGTSAMVMIRVVVGMEAGGGVEAGVDASMVAVGVGAGIPSGPRGSRW